MNIKFPMTSKAYYSSDSNAANKAALVLIAKRYFKEIQQAEQLTNVPGGLIASVIFTESRGNASIVAPSGAIGLMQLKTQSANDTIFLEKKNNRLSENELKILRSFLGTRLDGILKMKYLGHKLKENGMNANVITKADLQNPAFNILVGAMLLGLLIDQHTAGSTIRLDKALIRYNQGYFFKTPGNSVEETLSHVRSKSAEAYAYVLKVVGKNGLLEVQV